MCCQDTEEFELPAAVIEAIASYRRMCAERGWDWGGEDLPDFFRWARFSLLGPVFEAYADTGDWAAAIRSVVGDAPPAGVVLVTLTADGGARVEVGPGRTAIAGRTVPVDVVLDSAAGTDLTVTLAGRSVPVPAGGAALATVDVSGPFEVAVGGAARAVPDAVRSAPAAELRLSSPECTRWSVTDDSGGAWFPDGVPHKWDVHHRPFFHGHELTVAVPAVPLHVVCTRGIEYERVERDVHPEAGGSTVIECAPARVCDPAAAGWYGGDLHIHLNYSGDLVCTPADFARMQLGEGLHLANLTAGNMTTSHVYDRVMLERLAGVDLPWSGETQVARMGVEFRNDLLGHVHALGPAAPPRRYHTGHAGTDEPYDWPPNSAACAELRGLDATVGYAHPSFAGFPDGSTERFLANPRSVEARELVADAALGLVDSVDVISPFDHEGAAFLYHRLLSCGLRLAATAGTDVFLSFAHGPVVASNPPGWGRVYAQLDGPLSVAAFRDAIRAGRTTVTNGPFLTLSVNGHEPGAVLDLTVGQPVRAHARLHGPGADEVCLVGPDGVLARGDTEVSYRGVAGTPTWIAALARGAGHPNTLDTSVFAHTSPVYLDVAGQRVGRAKDARWCLTLLDGVERLASEHGRFDPRHRQTQLDDLIAVLDRARDYYRSIIAR